MSLYKKLKKLSREKNEELVCIAENGGFTENKDFDEGYVEGLRSYHLELIELLKGYKE